MAKSRDLGMLHYQSALFKTNRIWRNAPKVVVSRIMGDYKNDTLGENILLYVSIAELHTYNYWFAAHLFQPMGNSCVPFPCSLDNDRE